RLVAAKQVTDQCAGALRPRLLQEAEQRRWSGGELARSRALYRRKCERMLAALKDSMPESARWTTPHGGFFSWLTLPGVDAVELAGRAVEEGVAVVPGMLFYPDGRGTASLRLSYSLVDEELIDDGIARLRAVLVASA